MPFGMWTHGAQGTLYEMGGADPPTGRGTFGVDLLRHAWQLIYLKQLSRGQHMAVQPASHPYYSNLFLVIRE